MMILPNVKKTNTRRRIALAVLLCLAPVLLFLSCPMEGGTGGGGGDGGGSGGGDTPPSLFGTWLGVVLPENTPDTYGISAATLEYDDNSAAYHFEYAGDIKKITAFTSSAGVIILQYTSVDPSQGTAGDFFGVYYRELSAGTVKMANAYDLTNQEYPSADSLEQAQTQFTVGNAGKYVSVWGAYKRQ
ncbi:MAG: hypothetical protein LBK62_00560 [Treponema sp.]|jgi:hypothetical protein|nr:hypothetical protein [Treponema sp.]